MLVKFQVTVDCISQVFPAEHSYPFRQISIYNDTLLYPNQEVSIDAICFQLLEEVSVGHTIEGLFEIKVHYI